MRRAVNVGHVRLFRFSRIFQRANGIELPIKVACIRDRDIAPANTPDDMRKKLQIANELDDAQIQAHVEKLKEDDEGSVVTFVSDAWTFEHDLAAASWTLAKIMHQAIQVAKASKNSWPTKEKLSAIKSRALDEVEAWETEDRTLAAVALDVYRPLRLEKVSKSIAAQHAAQLVAEASVAMIDLPQYLQDALVNVCGPA